MNFPSITMSKAGKDLGIEPQDWCLQKLPIFLGSFFW